VNAADAEELALEQDRRITHDGGIWQHCRSRRNRPTANGACSVNARSTAMIGRRA
jgi:hypothetical protein